MPINTYVDAGIISRFSLSAALLIDPCTALNAAASIPAPSTPDVPEGTRRGPSDSCELTPATLLLLLLLRDRIWKLLQLLGRVMFPVELSTGGPSIGCKWLGGCFPAKYHKYLYKCWEVNAHSLYPSAKGSIKPLEILSTPHPPRAGNFHLSFFKLFLRVVNKYY